VLPLFAIQLACAVCIGTIIFTTIPADIIAKVTAVIANPVIAALVDLASEFIVIVSGQAYEL
jgi:hypothetical protein